MHGKHSVVPKLSLNTDMATSTVAYMYRALPW